jgi:nucleotide-binding universal stress UspA family protein
MARVLACIDGSIYSHSVTDHAAWAATRLGASVEVMEVLGRRESISQDRSGTILAGARRQLLEHLATLDAERAKITQAKARLDLEEARDRLAAAGIPDATMSLRNGDLMENLTEREGGADLVVIGKRGAAADFAKLHLGSNLERILRAATRPVLIAARAFRPIERALIAFDGRPQAMKLVDYASRSALFRGLAVTLLTAGEPGPEQRRAIDAALAQLRAGGLSVDSLVEPGRADAAIPAVVERARIDLVAMGAYSHSRFRTLVIGSTTAEVIRGCKTPLLVFHRTILAKP